MSSFPATPLSPFALSGRQSFDTAVGAVRQRVFCVCDGEYSSVERGQI
jgi:hypothetical protein